MTKKTTKHEDAGTTSRNSRSTNTGRWGGRPFPGEGHETEAFRITNDWAKALLAWEARIRAMCAIMEVKFEVSETAFAAVLKSIDEGKHNHDEIKRILEMNKKGEKEDRSPGVALPSDVVGHPPDPPFDPAF